MDTNIKRALATPVVLILLALCAGCGGGGSDYLNLITSVAVAPANPSIAKGTTQSFTATTTWQDGSTLDATDWGTQVAGAQVAWTSSNASVATVNATGVATAVGVGTTTITVTVSGSLMVHSQTIHGSATLTVTAPTVVSIAVAPANVALELGVSQYFTATSTLTDGSQQDVTQTATWSSGNVAVVRVNTTAGRIGVANTRGPGSAVVKATIGSVSGQASATVTRRTPKFLYAANLGASTVSAFSVDPATGALSQIGKAYATSNGSTSLAVTRDFKFLYTADFSIGKVSGFVIEPDGTLIPTAGSPIAAGATPLSVVTHPKADFLYVSQANVGIDTYAIDTVSGTPTLAGSASPSPFGQEFATMSPDGRFFYQTLSGIDEIAAFSVDGATGALTPLSSGTVATEHFPRAVAVDPAGKFLYVAIYDGGTGTSRTVDGFLIDPVSGALTAMPGSPFPVPATSTWIAIDPSGRFLYVSCPQASEIAAYTIDPDVGTLRAVPGSPFAAPGMPGFVMVDPSGLFLYAGTGDTKAGVLGYSIDQATGALTPNAAASAPGNIVWSLAATY